MPQNMTLKDFLRADHDEPTFDTSHLESVLEPHEMPPLDHSNAGMQNASRARVVRALVKKYGPTFKIHPAVSKALKGYDDEVHFHKLYQNTARIRHAGTR